jgi:hypothetical protein
MSLQRGNGGTAVARAATGAGVKAGTSTQAGLLLAVRQALTEQVRRQALGRSWGTGVGQAPAGRCGQAAAPGQVAINGGGHERTSGLGHLDVASNRCA